MHLFLEVIERRERVNNVEQELINIMDNNVACVNVYINRERESEGERFTSSKTNFGP